MGCGLNEVLLWRMSQCTMAQVYMKRAMVLGIGFLVVSFFVLIFIHADCSVTEVVLNVPLSEGGQ